MPLFSFPLILPAFAKSISERTYASHPFFQEGNFESCLRFSSAQKGNSRPRARSSLKNLPRTWKPLSRHNQPFTAPVFLASRCFSGSTSLLLSLNYPVSCPLYLPVCRLVREIGRKWERGNGKWWWCGVVWCGVEWCGYVKLL